MIRVAKGLLLAALVAVWAAGVFGIPEAYGGAEVLVAEEGQ